MPNVNKVVLGDETLLDLTEVTVTPGSLLSGYTAHAADGSIITGTKQGTPSAKLTTKTVTANGTYTPPSGYAGFSQVTANVPISGKIITSKTITANGTYTASSDDSTKSGYGKVVVNVPKPGPTKKYTRLSDLPVAIGNSQGVVWNNEIHIFYSYYHYKWDGSSWSLVSSLPIDFYNGGAVVYNNVIHLLGTGSVHDETKHYKWNGSSWVIASTLPYENRCKDVVVYNNEIHMMFGDSDWTINKHYKWNGSSWTPVSTLPYKLNQSSVVVYNNEIHIMGGINESVEEAKYHYKWDGSSWSPDTSLPYVFYGGRATVYKDALHILGSSNRDYCRCHYTLNGSSWDVEPYLSYNFEDAIGIEFGDDLHIIGSGYRDAGMRYPYRHYKYNDGEVSYKTYIDNVLQQRDLDFETVEDSGQAARWDSISTIPYIFYNGSAVTYNDNIYLFGGEESKRYVYKWNGSSWVSAFTLYYDFYNGAALYYDGKFYLVYQGNLARIDVDGTNSLMGSNGAYDFRNGSAVIMDGEIHMLGSSVSGDKNEHYATQGLRNWSTSSWGHSTRISTLPAYGLYLGGAVVYENTIHILGVNEQSNRLNNGHYKLTGTTGFYSWERVSTLPYDFYGGCAAVINGEIHIFGSMNPGDETKHYKWNGSSWSEDVAVPYDFYLGSATILNNKVHIFGRDHDYSSRYSFGQYHYALTPGGGTTQKLYRLIPPEPDEEGD